MITTKSTFFKKVISVSVLASMVFQSSNSFNSTYAVEPNHPDKTVFAMKSELISSWGTPRLNDANNIVSGTNASNQKILFGKDSETNKPLSWLIASRVLKNGKVSSNPGSSSHMVILSADKISNESFNLSETECINFDELKDTFQKEFEYIKNKTEQFLSNHYGVSDCRKNLKTIVSSGSMFSKGEKELLKETSVKTFDFKNETEYTVNDKLYLPGVNSKLNLRSWSEKDICRETDISKIEKEYIIPSDYLVSHLSRNNSILWSRCADPEKTSCVGVFLSSNNLLIQYIAPNYKFDVMALSKISVEPLLFASAASSVYADDISTLNGKFSKVEKESNNFGMHLKFKADGTDLTDGFVILDEKNNKRVHYGNIPEKSFLTICATEKNDFSKSYTTSIQINKDGKNSEGFIDLDKLDTEVIGKDKELVLQVWVERQEQNGLVVSTLPVSTTFKMGESLKVSGIESVVYNANPRTLENLSVVLGDKRLKLGTDFSVEYTSNRNVGTALAVIKGAGEYSGFVAAKTFEIIPATPNIVISDKTVAFDGNVKFVDEAVVSGVSKEELSDSKITYTYYSDEQCKKKIFTYIPSSNKNKNLAKAPKELGVYYVKASITKSSNYLSAESKVAKLEIVEKI